MTLPSRPSFSRYLLIPLAAFLIWGAAMIVGFAALKVQDSPSESPDSLLARFGQFGDMFGSLNALFSGIAAIGAIYAIILQIWQTADLKKHDRDMFRRSKLEEVVKQVSGLRRLAEEARTHVRKLAYYKQELTEDDCADLWDRIQDLTSRSIDIQTVGSMYFRDTIETMVPNMEVVAKNVIYPLKAFYKRDANSSLRERAANVETGVSEFVEYVNSLLVHATTNVEDLVNRESAK